ncbi:MAG: hypothetical protein U0271_45290 [Polyangiaceae bacterium]
MNRIARPLALASLVLGVGCRQPSEVEPNGPASASSAAPTSSTPTVASASASPSSPIEAACGACQRGFQCLTGPGRALGCLPRQTLVANQQVCAILPNGEAWCWGYEGPWAPPPRRMELGGVELAQIHAYEAQVCGVTTAGALGCFDAVGFHSFPVTHIPPNVIDFRGRCLVQSDGALSCLQGAEFVRVLSDQHFLAETFEQLEANKLDCSVGAKGVVTCWQFGSGGDVKVLTPGLANVTQVIVVDNNGAAVDGRGQLYSFGDPQASAGAAPSKLEMKPMKGWENVAHFDGKCALLLDGRVACAGTGQFGELGTGDRRESVQTPFVVPGISDAVQVANGNGFACAQLASGKVMCWGRRENGSLGDGYSPIARDPTRVANVDGAVQIASSGDATCARLKDGSVTCWGLWPLEGSVTLQRGRPWVVPGVADALSLVGTSGGVCTTNKAGLLSCFKAGVPGSPATHFRYLGDIVAGGIVPCEPGEHCESLRGVALRKDGKILAFKTALEGGDVDVESRLITELGEDGGPDVSAVVSLAISGKSVCFVRAGGVVGCFDFWSNLGTGATRPLKGLKGVVDLQGASFGYCARLRSGEVDWFLSGDDIEPQEWARGAVSVARGGAGAGSAVRRDGTIVSNGSQMAKLNKLEDVVSIAAGAAHACALDRQGAVWCWGANDNDQLGGEESPIAFTPVEVPLPIGN